MEDVSIQRFSSHKKTTMPSHLLLRTGKADSISPSRPSLRDQQSKGLVEQGLS